MSKGSNKKTETRPAGLNERWRIPMVCIFLVAAIWLVFGQTLRHDFVNFDDDEYVYNNAQVTPGLTLHGIAWAFTTASSAYWHPLTWLSHMLDCQLWGLHAGGHHLTNVLLHSANAVLLFLVLRRMTSLHPGTGTGAPARARPGSSTPADALWCSAFVAAVFAIHPLDVESVAWVAQRKNVLSTFFWLLTMGAYVGYVVKPDWRRYALVMICYGLGLMSKPMLVTLPFVLLLLDYWPLERIVIAQGADGGSVPRPLRQAARLAFEKVPLLLLAVVSSVVTYLGQKNLSSVTTLKESPLGVRLAKVSVNYVGYLRDTIWPENLTVLYPYPPTFSVATVALCVLLLAGISLLVLWSIRSKPYLAVGWFWFVGTMVPVIGLVQVGNTPVADRFTYVPQIGLYLMGAWAVRDLTVSWCRRQWQFAAAVVVISALMVRASIQTSYWRNSESLWTHVLACNPENVHAHGNLGNALLQKGEVDEAIHQFQKALQIKPNDAEIHNNLGNALLQKGEVDEAITHFQKALQIKPDDAEIHNNLGNALLQKGEADKAIVHYQKALQIKPDDAEIHYNLGNVLFQKGETDEAITHFQKALQIKPDYADAHHNLGCALLQKGNVDEAIAHFQKTLQIKPDDTDAQINLAWVLATASQESLRNGNQAVELAQQANQLAGGENPTILNTLAAAYAEVGRFSDAKRSAQKAIELAQAAGKKDLAAQINSELKLYERGLPFHQESK
jgi:Flp pilus assembly protein TadD